MLLLDGRMREVEVRRRTQGTEAGGDREEADRGLAGTAAAGQNDRKRGNRVGAARGSGGGEERTEAEERSHAERPSPLATGSALQTEQKENRRGGGPEAVAAAVTDAGNRGKVKISGKGRHDAEVAPSMVSSTPEGKRRRRAPLTDRV